MIIRTRIRYAAPEVSGSMWRGVLWALGVDIHTGWHAFLEREVRAKADAK
jgi:hypothetical protein